jgi:hypothetical protein
MVQFYSFSTITRVPDCRRASLLTDDRPCLQTTASVPSDESVPACRRKGPLPADDSARAFRRIGPLPADDSIRAFRRKRPSLQTRASLPADEKGSCLQTTVPLPSDESVPACRRQRPYLRSRGSCCFTHVTYHSFTTSDKMTYAVIRGVSHCIVRSQNRHVMYLHLSYDSM